MSVRYGLLGLLAEGPASGYDLLGRFEELLSPVWPARHPQIYQELNRLADDHLIEHESTGPRGRKVYRITDEGVVEVRRWLSTVQVDHTVRLEPVLRSIFFWLMDPGLLREHLEREADYFASQAEHFRALAKGKDFQASPRLQSLRVALEAGIRLYEALEAWARWAEETPPAQPGGDAVGGRAD